MKTPEKGDMFKSTKYIFTVKRSRTYGMTVNIDDLEGNRVNSRIEMSWSYYKSQYDRGYITDYKKPDTLPEELFEI